RTLGVSLLSRLDTLKCAATAAKAALAGAVALPPADSRALVLFLSHAAFWRRRRSPDGGEEAAYEHYFDRILPEVASQSDLRACVVAVGPTAAFRRRGVTERLAEWGRLPPESGPYVHVNRFTSLRVLREVRRAVRDVRRAWRMLRRSPGMAEAFSHRGVAFADLAG